MTWVRISWWRLILFLWTGQWLVTGSLANLNLFLNQFEVRQLLGLQAELYYVRNGVVNEYALDFRVLVPAELEQLHFTWQSLIGQPLPYALSVEYSDHAAMAPPYLNISSRGSVPNQSQTFSLHLPCTGTVDAEVNVTIAINVTLKQHTDKPTTLKINRKKICLKESSGVGRIPAPDAGDVVPSSSTLFYLALGLAVALSSLLCLALAICYVQGNKRRRQGIVHVRLPCNETRAPGSSGSGGSYVVDGRSAASVQPGQLCTTASCPSVSTATTPVNVLDSEQRIAELTIQRYRVRLRSVILEGTFSRVYRGTYSPEHGPEEEVLVKTVSDHASETQISLLLQEGMALYEISHKNLLTVLGVSIEDHTAPFLIYPYHSNSANLKQFLHTCKGGCRGAAIAPPQVSLKGSPIIEGSPLARILTTQELVAMALHVVSAMQYLHKRRLLHRDLATRNCIIDERTLRVQVADNALSRDLFPADYHCLGDNENRPVKWLASESLVHGAFSTASDVWAFGVLLWELTTLAQQPYAEIDPFELAEYLQDGYRLTQPVNCPDELFSVMACCWAMSPDERPTFSQLNVCLQQFHSQLTRYV